MPDSIVQGLRKSRCFFQGPNTARHICNCDKCQESPSRHLSDLSRAIPGHSYWRYLEFCLSCTPRDGLLLEFGVFKAATLTFIAERSPIVVYGFDSFHGLPHDWHRSSTDTLHAGTYAMGGIPPDVTPRNVRFVVGMFEDTLPGFLEATPGRTALVHIDCDEYEPTRFVLAELLRHQRLTPGTVILFDEFYNYPHYSDHEYRAFKEFVAFSGIAYRWLAHTDSCHTANGNGQQAALVVKAVPSHVPAKLTDDRRTSHADRA